MSLTALICARALRFARSNGREVGTATPVGLSFPWDSGCYTGMTRPNPRLKQQAEKRFPHKVDVPVPPGGIGKRLNAMHLSDGRNVRSVGCRT